jgi:hypothetical protein
MTTPKHRRQGGLRPRLISIYDGCNYANVGKTKFYKYFVPRVKTVKLGTRTLIDLESLDALIDELMGEVAG